MAINKCLTKFKIFKEEIKREELFRLLTELNYKIKQILYISGKLILIEEIIAKGSIQIGFNKLMRYAKNFYALIIICVNS